MPYSAAEMYPDSQRKRLGTSRLVSTLFLPLAWMILVPSLRTWACPESAEAALLTHSFARLPESHGNTGESRSTEHHQAGLVPSWFSSSGLVRAQNRRLHPQRLQRRTSTCRLRPGAGPVHGSGSGAEPSPARRSPPLLTSARRLQGDTGHSPSQE